MDKRSDCVPSSQNGQRGIVLASQAARDRMRSQMHLGPNPDSVVPAGLDLGATCIPGLKPGAILFRPFGTQCAPARQRVPVRTGKRSATEGSEIPEFEHAGAERGHVPSAVRGATTCPRSDRMGGHGGLPLQGEADGQSRMRRRCPPILAAPKGRPRTARGLARRSAARPE